MGRNGRRDDSLCLKLVIDSNADRKIWLLFARKSRVHVDKLYREINVVANFSLWFITKQDIPKNSNCCYLWDASFDIIS